MKKCLYHQIQAFFSGIPGKISANYIESSGIYLYYGNIARWCKFMEYIGLALVSVILAYLLGTLNAAYYMMKWKHGIDIRTIGSGNAGATNAGRAMGKKGFFLVLIFDLAKGMLAVLFVRESGQTELIAGLSVIAAVLGHIFPVQLRFKGAKESLCPWGHLSSFPIKQPSCCLRSSYSSILSSEDSASPVCSPMAAQPSCFRFYVSIC